MSERKLTIEEHERIQELLGMGITIDGAHHKQWCLVEIAKVLGISYSGEDQGTAP